MRNTRRSDVAPIQTPQRLNRLIDRSAEWAELSGTQSKGSRGHLRSPRTFSIFFVFSSRTGSYPAHSQGTGTQVTGYATRTNQDSASQNVPTSLLTQNNFRFARLNVVAGATDASRAMLLTSCRKVELLTAIFGFL